MRKRTWFIILFITAAAGLLVFTGCPNGTTADGSGDGLSVTGVSLNRSGTSTTIGNSKQLTAMVRPANAADKSVSWTSSDDLVATVSDSGLVTEVSLGTVTISVTTTDGGFTDTCTVTVRSPGDQEILTAGSVSFTMVIVPGKNLKTGIEDAGTATVNNSYWIAETEVTYELWSTVYLWATSNSFTFANAGVKGNDGDAGKTTQHPVTTINWRDIMVWSNALTEYYNAQNSTSLECVYYTDSGYTTSIRNSSDGSYGSSVDTTPGSFDDPYVKSDANGFRLLTSNEWELAARYIDDANSDGDIYDSGEYYPGEYASGADAVYNVVASSDYDGDGDTESTTDVAVYDTNSGSSTAVVKSKSTNVLGLYDMSGNIYEWCFDWNTVGTYRALHGGNYYYSNAELRVGRPFNGNPYGEYYHCGFRLSRTP